MITRKRLLFSTALFALLVPQAFAQMNDRNMEKEEIIWQQLKTVAPETLETFKAATVALDKADYQESARLYQQVLKKAPEFDPALRRCGSSLVSIGQVKEGMALLESAVKKNRSPENLISLAQCLAYPGEGKQGTPADKDRALTLAKQAYDNLKDDDPSYPFMVAQLSLELDKQQDFRSVMKTIAVKYPDVMATHYFGAILAAMDEDWIKAEDEIKKAQSMGLPAEVADSFLALGIHSRATVWRYAYYALYMVAVWAAGLIVLFGLGKLMSNITLRSLETADPNNMTGGQDHSLRKFYKILINVAGFYYYISIPVIIFLVLATAAGVTYGFWMAGEIPIKLVALLIIGALITVFQMIRSLFIRIEQEDPGRCLNEAEAPGLWALAREVAQAVGTRPVDEIRVMPGTDLAVYEKGSFTERMQDRATRILIMGVGILNDFKQDSFRAVLAHEYGHFSHRDTAGGDAALRVNSDMMKFAYAIVASGQNVWWNIAFHFLRVYHFIFRRISHGATRLQEVLADRVAARIYGPVAFEQGLRHVIRRQVEFDDITYHEVTDALKTRRSVQNLYEMTASKENNIEEKINQEINRQSSEDDTHPSPIDRFRFTSRIVSVNQSSNSDLVWDLFTDKEAIAKEMSALVEQKAKAAAY